VASQKVELGPDAKRKEVQNMRNALILLPLQKVDLESDAKEKIFQSLRMFQFHCHFRTCG
jgi:hypothetical protein